MPEKAKRIDVMFTQDVYAEIRQEAARLQIPVSVLVRKAYQIAKSRLQRLAPEIDAQTSLEEIEKALARIHKIPKPIRPNLIKMIRDNSIVEDDMVARWLSLYSVCLHNEEF